MIRRYLPHALAIIAVLALVGVTRAWAGALGEARAHEARADALAPLVDSLTDRLGALSVQVADLDSARAAERARWDAERAQNRAQIASAQSAASQAASTLRPRLDSIGAALLAEYEAQVERERTEWAALLASVEAEVELLTDGIRARDSLIAGLYEVVDVREAETVSLRAANDALRRAVSPSIFARLTDSWELVALGAGLGIITWEVAR